MSSCHIAVGCCFQRTTKPNGYKKRISPKGLKDLYELSLSTMMLFFAYVF